MLQRGRIVEPRTVALLASPVRQDIVDTVEALGGSATARELAAELGRPADGLYYHLEILRKGGLLVATAGKSRGGREERRYRIPVARGELLTLVYRKDNHRQVRGVVGAMVRIARRDFDRALARPGTVGAGPARDLWAGRGTGWVSPRELRQLDRLLARAAAMLRKPRGRGRDKLVSLCFVLAPLAPKPIRRGATARRALP